MRMGLYRRNCFRWPRRRRRRCYPGCAWLLLAAVCIVFVCGLFYSNIRPVFLKRAEHYASETATKIVNQAVGKVFADDDIEYRDLVRLEKNAAGDIISIQSNTAKINRLKAEIEEAIRTEMEENEDGSVRIPFGSILKQETFASSGPKIKIKVNTSGVMALDFKDEFEAVGINQTKHKIYLDTELTLSIYSITMNLEETIHNQIPIAETVIVGNVPHYYSDSGNEIPAISDK